MSEYVLDASAVLALLNGEQGAERVAAILGDAAVSTVNSCEVIGQLIDAGMGDEDARSSIDLLNLEIVSFEAEMAFVAGQLRTGTKKLGLSLGDRCCLALGLLRGNKVVTAERTWDRLDIGIELEILR